MANEVKITTSYSFNDNGASFAGSSSFNYSITGVNAIGLVQSLNSGQCAALNFIGLADVRYLYLKNQSATGNAYLSLNSGQTQVFSILHPNESLAMPYVSTGLWASGQGGAVDLQICANES